MATRSIELEDFLKTRGTTLSRVIEKARSSLELAADDCLFAVGSLVEGLGTAKSDVDLLWLTHLDAESIPSAEDLTLVVGRCLVDVQPVPLTAMNELLSRLQAWSRLSWDTTHDAKFSFEERKLLHRLLYARPLQVIKRDASKWRPAAADLTRLKLHVARQYSRTIQVDMVGNREAGDFRSLVYAAQDLLGHAADALTAGYGFTNPIPKWRSRLLDQVPAGWEQSLPHRPARLSAGESVWRLHRGPEQLDKRAALAHAFRISTFARAVFAWAEMRLVNNSPKGKELIDWSFFTLPSPGPVLPHLDFDVDFRIIEGRVFMGRLNEFGETVELSQREFALALLCDGSTTLPDAETAVFGTRSDGAARRTIKRLLSNLKQAGLSVPGRRVEMTTNGRKSVRSAFIPGS
ncbi:MAG TPA: hypothetical protein VHH35_07935 [Pyrinomonadaceae bacterium]|nr:hypothetical protein [Pyrinomonadaceae bacterium]